jgi:hypothetical protein
MTPNTGCRRALAAAAALWACLASPTWAQPPAEDEPAFSLSTSQVFTTRDAPHFYLTFRHLPSLDLRVYKVRDSFAFFAGLRDLHQMGTDERPLVPQERSFLERLSDWKRLQRSRLRTFVRAQISREYRAQRTAARDRTQTAQRVRLNVNTFAQVPLLNPDQLVTSWRELLPDHRDPEVRRVPVEVKERVRRRPGHEDIPGSDADFRRQPLQRRAGRQLRHARARRSEAAGRGQDVGERDV